MNKLYQIKLQIFESYDQKMITESEKDELLYIVEKRTRDQYAREKFKKKYNFVPDKPGSDKGTITINGEKRHIDMGKSNFVDFGGDTIDRQMGSDLNSENGDILIDKRFFKYKNAKRRDAMLQHEFGHTKLHLVNGDAKTLDPRTFSQKNRGVAKQTLFNSNKKALAELGYDTSDKKTRRLINNELDAVFKNNKSYKEKSDKNEYRKKRDELLKHASKYKNKDSYHANEQEFEADRYATNKTGKKHMKKSISEQYKLMRKDFKKSGVSKKEIKDFNKGASVDYKARSKALEDKKLRDADLYK